MSTRFGIVLALLPLCALACQGPLVQRAADARQVYREASFDREALRREGLALLPARLSFGYETFGPALTQGLIDALDQELGGRGLIRPSRSASRINEAGLAREYGEMLRAYQDTGILDAPILRKISAEVPARYFAVPFLIDYREGSDSRFGVFGLRVGKTKWSSTRCQLQIWDGHSGRIVWEGSSELTLARETVLERPVLLEDSTRAPWQALVEKLPTSDVGAPGR